MDDSDDDGEFLSYPPTISPVEHSTTHPETENNNTPREKLKFRRRSRSSDSMKEQSCPALCDECEVSTAIATIHCQDCDLNYCSTCDENRHRKGKLALHERTTLKSETTEPVVASRSPLQWTTKEVADWLGKLDLQVYETAFMEKQINGAALLALRPHDLEALDEITLASRGHKKKLQREIQKIKDTNPTKHNQLRVTVETSSLERRRSDLTSPVAALRAKINQGQMEKGRVVTRRNTSEIFIKPVLDISSDASHAPQVDRAESFTKRRPIVGLGLDLNQVDEKSTKASFDFTAEGRLQSHGFEINTHGIASTPFHTGQTKTLLGTKESLILLNELGHGASGKVYKALYLPTFKLVAVKVIRVYDQKKRHQMLRELKSLYANFVSLNDTGKSAACQDLVMFYDAYTNPEIGSVSIVLEYMDGGSLELESTLAEAATFTGTLLYMAPERISGGSYSYPSDIWSFGLALMACAIGKLPVTTEDGYWGVVHAIQEQPSPRLRDYGEFSPDLCDFVDQCLEKDPLKRPPAQTLLLHPFIQKHVASKPTFPSKTPASRERHMDELHQIAEKIRVDNPATRTKALSALAKQMQVPYEDIESVFSFF
ncbi:unnamed protein product [Aphanomyces euteiches]